MSQNQKNRKGSTVIHWLAVALLVGFLVGTVGATTITINATYDRLLRCNPSGNATFEQLRICNTTTASVTTLSDTLYGDYIAALGSGYDEFYDQMYLSGITFNTTGILPASAVVDSALVILNTKARQTGLGATVPSLIDFFPINATSYTSTDYNRTTFTRMAPDVEAPTAANQTRIFQLNSDGLSKINNSGYTSFQLRSNRSVDDVGYNWVASVTSYITWRPLDFDSGNFSEQLSITYHLPTNPPVVSFTTNVTSGTAPLPVQFTDASTNTPTGWNWSFGDSTYSTIQNATHTYTGAGNFSVSLTATNAAGSNISAQKTWINVTSSLNAMFTPRGIYTTYIPQGVAFNASASTGSPTVYNWSFGDGTYSNGTASSIYHTWWQMGTYTVTLNASTASAYSINSTRIIVMPGGGRGL